MVLLGNLPLTACSESIEPVSISRSKRLRKKEDKSTDKTFVTQYMKRPTEYEDSNMADYYHTFKNGDSKEPDDRYCIPNFVGINGTPRFPVSESYAKHTIVTFRPWREYPTSDNWPAEFEIFINSPNCPDAAKLPYERILKRSIDKMLHYEPTASDGTHSGNPISEEDQMLMDLTGLKIDESDNTDYDSNLIRNMDKGIHHEWHKDPIVSHFRDACFLQLPQKLYTNIFIVFLFFIHQILPGTCISPRR